MLQEIHIANFALIDEQRIAFGPGLNVISGESGAGKSIILHALELLLGARAKPHMLRSGAAAMEVEALFDLSHLSQAVRVGLPDIAQSDELILSRTLSDSGKSKVYINGRMGSVALLEEIAKRLINICGQNQFVRLLDSKFHLELLDSFGGYEQILHRYKESFIKWRALSSELDRLTDNCNTGEARRAELEGIVAELQSVKLTLSLKSDLEVEIRRLSAAEEIVRLGQVCIERLSAEGGVLSQLRAALGELETLSTFDSNLKGCRELTHSARTELDECEFTLRRHLSNVEINEDKLLTLREQLSEVARLERKYQKSCAELIEVLNQAKSELVGLSKVSNLEDLKREVVSHLGILTREGAELTRKRKEAGRKLVKEVEDELKDLNMEGVKLSLNFLQVDPGPNGQDALELLMSTTRGSEPKPLKYIASGGELSRIMLVLKKVLKDRSGVNVLVFDEVDSGVSGSVARAIGAKLKSLSENSQVICITHLPQVASLADRHILVHKESHKGTHRTSAREILGEERVNEIARMLAGYTITPASKESARELLSSNS